MAFTTADVELAASQSNAALATVTGSWVDITGRGGGLVTAKITNGATGPTLGCAFYLDVSPDNGSTIYLEYGYGLADVANNGEYTFAVYVPPGVRYLRVRFTGNTGQTVTVQADFMAFAGV